jgi:hypothetical protein
MANNVDFNEAKTRRRVLPLPTMVALLVLEGVISTFADISPSGLRHRDSLAAGPTGNLN